MIFNHFCTDFSWNVAFGDWVSFSFLIECLICFSFTLYLTLRYSSSYYLVIVLKKTWTSFYVRRFAVYLFKWRLVLFSKVQLWKIYEYIWIFYKDKFCFVLFYSICESKFYIVLSFTYFPNFIMVLAYHQLLFVKTDSWFYSSIYIYI